MTRVLHLVGSPTSDFFADLSRLYATGCLDALAGDDRWEPLIAYVTPDGRWRFPTSLDAAALDDAATMSEQAALDQLAQLRADVAVPQMFCLPGMTRYRALLDDAGIPYVGNRPATMADGADKVRTKELVEAAGVAVPAAVEVSRDARGALVDVTLPVVVKPVDADNSDGVTLVRTRDELGAAVDEALRHSERALVETYVELGREVRCGVLERPDGLLVLPLEEYAVDAVDKPVRDAADKLARSNGDLRLVAKSTDYAWILPPDDPAATAVGAAARLAHRALGCRHYSLFDFRIDPAGRPWLLEAGLYCSFAPSSVIVTMAAAAGIGLHDLFASAAAQAVTGPAAAHRS